MLALTRHKGERIIIRVGEVEIKVSFAQLRRDGGIVLGFEAPLHVTIHREEVQARIDSGERMEQK